MTSYAHLTFLETLSMTVISVLSNLGGIPIVASTLPYRPTRFQGVIAAMSLTTSFLYHLCEIYECRIFLDELQWHRLDNVFAITSFELVILHSLGSITDEDEALRWATFLTAIVIQEKDPWNVAYTVAPCIMFGIIGIAIRYHFRQSRKVVYNRRNMITAIAPFCIGMFFFYLGLDEKNDYLRIFHGAWHICASIFGYYCFTSVKVIDRDAKSHREDFTSLQF